MRKSLGAFGSGLHFLMLLSWIVAEASALASQEYISQLQHSISSKTLSGSSIDEPGRALLQAEHPGWFVRAEASTTNQEYILSFSILNYYKTFFVLSLDNSWFG